MRHGQIGPSASGRSKRQFDSAGYGVKLYRPAMIVKNYSVNQSARVTLRAVVPPAREPHAGIATPEPISSLQQGGSIMAGAQTSGGGDLGFEAELFKAADNLRGNLEPSEYKHVALGLIFLKYISKAFEAQHIRLLAEEFADPEDPEEYLAANVFWVPAEARWAHLQANAKRREIEFVDVTTGQTKKGDIGGLIDNAMEAIEKANITVLKDVLPKIFAQPKLDKTMVGELIDLFYNIDLGGGDPGKARDLLGRAYEYFISQFAGAEGKRGGEFFTPPSVVRTLVEYWSPTGAGSMTLAAARAACSCSRKSSSRTTPTSAT